MILRGVALPSNMYSKNADTKYYWMLFLQIIQAVCFPTLSWIKLKVPGRLNWVRPSLFCAQPTRHKVFALFLVKKIFCCFSCLSPVFMRDCKCHREISGVVFWAVAAFVFLLFNKLCLFFFFLFPTMLNPWPCLGSWTVKSIKWWKNEEVKVWGKKIQIKYKGEKSCVTSIHSAGCRRWHIISTFCQ